METIKIESQKRGQLTQRIKEMSVELLDYEITQNELRLIPYLQYKLVNEQRLKPEHINEVDNTMTYRHVACYEII